MLHSEKISKKYFVNGKSMQIAPKSRSRLNPDLSRKPKIGCPSSHLTPVSAAQTSWSANKGCCFLQYYKSTLTTSICRLYGVVHAPYFRQTSCIRFANWHHARICSNPGTVVYFWRSIVSAPSARKSSQESIGGVHNVWK